MTSTSQHLDWEAIRQRMERAAESLAAADRLTPEQARAVMDRRARELAQVPAPAPDTSQIVEVLKFGLDDEQFAIETRHVREVIPPGDITPLPGGPPFLAGLTNLRGEVLAVMDLRTFFGIRANDNAAGRRWVVILGDQRVEFGLLVDDIDEVAPLPIGEILDPSASAAAATREFVRGVTAEALLVIDGDKLLSDERLFVDQSDKVREPDPKGD